MRILVCSVLFLTTLSQAAEWKMANSAGRTNAPMTTVWGEKLTPENAWREYPRPQMVRSDWTCLNGLWDYAVTPIASTSGRPEKWDGKILVPFGIESPLSGVGRYLQPDEFLWYTRKLTVKKEDGRRILLHFESIDWRAQVFIGHREVGIPHESLNVPFSLDITDYVVNGDNHLTVCVWDPTDSSPYGTIGKQYIKPRSCFYTRTSGILGTVWMETVPQTYIPDFVVTPDIDAGKVVFNVKSSSWRETKVSVEIYDGLRRIARGKGYVGEDITIAMPKGFKLWSPDSPALYDAVLRLGDDEVKTYFAMRKISKVKDAKGILRFALNNQPVFLLATLDQGWWPDGLLTPPSDEALAYDVKVLKEYGFNSVRKHIKVEPRRFYHHCDRLGLMVLQDMPSGAPQNDGTASPDNGMATDTWRYGFFRRDFQCVVDHLRNAPSIVMWIPYNEGWGQPGEFLTHSTLDWIRQYDPSRLVNGPSGWNDYEGGRRRTTYANWGGWAESSHKPAGACEASDIIDRHDYGPRPAVFPANDRRISFLGEFGGINLKVPGHMWNPAGHFGYQQRNSREELLKAYDDLFKYVAEQIPKCLGGCVYTQTTDVEVETNGLMTYDRKVKKYDPAKLRAIHARMRLDNE